MDAIEYRYELKYELNATVAEMLKHQLKCLMGQDPHSVCDEYSYDIRSLYFDDPDSTAYFEKLNGDKFRKKYRMRMYNGDDSVINMECKYKHENMTYKRSCRLTREAADAIIDGRYSSIVTKNAFLQQFLAEAQSSHLKPSVIVDYRRLALTYPVSEVRITFDYQLRSGVYSDRFFDKDIPTLSLLRDDQVVLEVKFNEYLPDHLSQVLSSVPTLREAVSKFALCRSVK